MELFYFSFFIYLFSLLPSFSPILFVLILSLLSYFIDYAFTYFSFSLFLSSYIKLFLGFKSFFPLFSFTLFILSLFYPLLPLLSFSSGYSIFFFKLTFFNYFLYPDPPPITMQVATISPFMYIVPGFFLQSATPLVYFLSSTTFYDLIFFPL